MSVRNMVDADCYGESPLMAENRQRVGGRTSDGRAFHKDTMFINQNRYSGQSGRETGESWTNEFLPRNSGKLFLGGLSWDTEDQDIRSYFSKYGQVVDISIKHDALTGKPRGFGFITFATEAPVDAVLNSGPHVIRNRTIDPKRPKSRPTCKKIFVGGVDSAMSEDEIREYFTQFGTVEGIELPFDRQRNQRREFCFIIFDSEEAAEAALKEPRQTIGSKECDIKKAQPAQQQQRRMQGGNVSYGFEGESRGWSDGRGRSRRGQGSDRSQPQGYYQGYYGATNRDLPYDYSQQGYDY